MLRKMHLTSLIVFVAAMPPIVSGQCPTPINITGGIGELQSPNVGMEYGKDASCAWRLSSKDWTKYALRLHVKELRLYLPRSTCVTGSYNLTIDGDLLQCPRFASESRENTFCHAYYNDETCESLSDVTGCEVSREKEFPIEVKYNADGRTISNDSASTMWGFKIGYKLIECPDIKTTAHPKATTHSATTAEDMNTDYKTIESNSNGKTTTTPAAGFPLPLVVGAAGGGAIILLLIIIVIIVCKKRRDGTKTTQVTTDTETVVTTYSGEIRMKKVEDIEIEEEPYTVITGSLNNHNAKSDAEDKLPISDYGAEQNHTYTAITGIQNIDSASDSPQGIQDSDVYNTIPNNFQSKKVTVINSAISTTRQPELTFEQDSTYTIMTGNTPVKPPAQNFGEDEGNTYSEMAIKQHPKDVYAVSTKSKKHQSSIEPEQDSTYTEISHAPQNILKTSSTRHSNEAGDIYAIIPNDPAQNIVTGQFTQGENPILHHAQEDAYAAISNSNAAKRYSDVYAVVEHPPGSKNTNSIPETKTNILYVPAPQ